MTERKKITFIGGGSYQWVPLLFRDLAVNPHLQNIRFVLHDIDAARNREMAEVCAILARKLKSSILLETEDDCAHAIDGADAVVLCISTGGLDAMEHDIEIPKKYGIYQPVGDSTGPGGISRTLRNVPVVVDLVRQMEKLCPEAWLVNLTNPMSQIVRAVQKISDIKVVGLCHEFQSFMGAVQHLLGLTDWKRETMATIAGINHFSWMTNLNVRGKDGLKLLRECGNRVGPLPNGDATQLVNQSHSLSGNLVKFALLKTYGAMPYPGDRHLVEFFPYFVLEKNRYGADFAVRLTSIEDRRTTFMRWYKERIAEWTSESPDSVPREASSEALTPVLAALVSDGPVTVQPATMPNKGQVSNLPMDSSVETLATFVNGIASPHASGALPPSIHALVLKHCLNQDLMVEAALDGSRFKALQAMLADPLNSNNDPKEIEAMLEELLLANAVLLPRFFSNGQVVSKG